MFIQSQDKTTIIPLSNYSLGVYEYDVFASMIVAVANKEKLIMGHYLYPSQAFEIMDDIRNNIINNFQGVYEMPKIKMSLFE